MINIRMFHSMLIQIKTRSKFQNRKNGLKNVVVESKFPRISRLKFGRFAKSHIYSERGDFGASSYDKNSNSIFFEKVGFRGGGD